MGCCASKSEPKADKYAVSSDAPTYQKQVSPSRPTITSAPAPVEAPAVRPAGPVGGISEYKPSRPKLDPKDFRFENLHNQTAIKLPGTTKGQMFVIDKCENCNIYVMDFCGQVTIDDCKNCNIFIGPTDGSIFIRDCSDCRCAFVCRQLRTRDCTDLDLLLHCRTRPIIESSVQLRFGCFDYAYRDLPAHMASAKLSYLHNFWSDVYDFTPPAAGRLNWTFLPDDRARVSVLLAPVPKEVVDMAVPDARELLRSWGARPARGDLAQPDAESLFVIFPPSASAKGAELIREVSSRSSSGRSLALLWTNDAKVTMDVALQLAAAAGWDKAAARQLTVGGGACVGAQLVGSKVEAGEVAQAARAASALVSGSRDAGSLFRELGIEG